MNPYRSRNPLELLLASICEREGKLSFKFVINLARNTNAAWFSETFEAGRRIDPVAENVTILSDSDVTDVDAYPQPHTLILGLHLGTLFHRFLHFYGAADRENR